MTDVANIEPLSASEAIAIVNLEAARAAKAGNYALHTDLTMVAECIDRLADQLAAHRSAGAELVRQVLSARESFRDA